MIRLHLGQGCVITGAKREARSGELETTYRYWLLEPGGVQRRVELDPFKVVGRFTIAEQKNGKAASEATRNRRSGVGVLVGCHRWTLRSSSSAREAAKAAP